MVTTFYWIIMFMTMAVSCSQKETKKTYFENGNLSSSIELVDGVKSGLEKKYYESGKLKAEVSWKRNQQDGESRFYFDNGILKSTSFWKVGKVNGMVTNYYESGKLKSESHYKNGLQDGVLKIYDEQGNILQISRFKNGIRNGQQLTFYPDGSIQSKKNFLNMSNSEVLTGTVSFNRLGQVIDQSVRLEVMADSTEYDSKNLTTLNLELINPYFESTRLVLGDYSSLFTSLDSSTLDTVQLVGHIGEISISKGDTLRGFFDNYDIVGKSGDTLISKHSFVYFEYP